MTGPVDFRIGNFNARVIIKCGKYVGEKAYWKLFSIENNLRVIIHSVLSVQARPDWWDEHVDESIRKTAIRFERQYDLVRSQTKPGKHGIYYIGLRDLGEIFRANRNLFDPLMPDLEEWLLKIEIIRMPRNLVAHSNNPKHVDYQKIDQVYRASKTLLKNISQKIPLVAPS
jgi:hypothetical protein